VLVVPRLGADAQDRWTARVKIALQARPMHAIQPSHGAQRHRVRRAGATGSPSMGVDDFAQRRGRSHEPIRRIERGGVCRRLPGNRSLAGAAKGEGPSFRAEGGSTGRWRKEALVEPSSRRQACIFERRPSYRPKVAKTKRATSRNHDKWMTAPVRVAPRPGLSNAASTSSTHCAKLGSPSRLAMVRSCQIERWPHRLT
jgi:hypothetical protein